MSRRLSEGHPMTAEMKRYLDEAAVARFLNVSSRTLQRWRVEGGGPQFIRAGARRVLYDAMEIERWVMAHTFPHRAAELSR
jgi:predicted DNA-binding transcriptional regulator AlpA